MAINNLYIWIAAAMIGAALIIIIAVLVSGHRKDRSSGSRQPSGSPNPGQGPAQGAGANSNQGSGQGPAQGAGPNPDLGTAPTTDLNQPPQPLGGYGQYGQPGPALQPYNPNVYQPGMAPQGAGYPQGEPGMAPQSPDYIGNMVTEDLRNPAFPGNPNMGMQAAPYQVQGYPYGGDFENEETINENFDADATIADAGPRVVWLKFTISFEGRVETEERILHEQLTLGRSDRCDVDVVFNGKDEEARQTSREHALILNSPDGVYVRDNGSRNGTYLNEEKIENDTPLKSGDVIRIGRSAITVEIENPS